jgi:hypothetical protein
VGECVVVTGDDVTKAECSSPEADYRVLAVKEQGTFFPPSFARQDVPGTVQIYSETRQTGFGATSGLCLGNK